MNRQVVHMFAAVLAFVMLIPGCAGIEPYDPPDYKEEPPGKGLLTGEKGEFSIYKGATSDSDE